ncbi:MAG: hypothetical protein K2K04_04430 [Clostridia bacterium]|nr:hypothetical protein [Clostridia bacterium]
MEKQKSAVLQMFYGENGKADYITYPPEEDKLLDEVDKYYDLMCEKLKPQEGLFELFEKFRESLENLRSFEADNYYAEGFKFGLLIGIEAGESKFK